MSLIKIGCISIVEYNRQFLSVFSEGRGYVFPGGKREDGETFTMAAIRELKEETNIDGTAVSLVHHGLNVDGYYIYAYHVAPHGLPRVGHKTHEGITTWATCDEMMASVYAPFYDTLFMQWREYKRGRYDS